MKPSDTITYKTVYALARARMRKSDTVRQRRALIARVEQEVARKLYHQKNLAEIKQKE